MSHGHESLTTAVGVKFISQQWALVPMQSPAITGSEDMARGLPAQPCWAGPGLFKRRPRRSVSSDAPNGSPIHTLNMVKGHPKSSSDAPNGSPIHTLNMVKGHPKSKENARRSGGNHNCRIKCKEATFLAALMWRGQGNSIILASATHRKGRRMSYGTGTQVEAQIINKCRVIIIRRMLYKRRKPP